MNPEELDFVDQDIRDYFESRYSSQCGWISGTPILFQLVKELRKLNESIRKREEGKK